MGAPAYGKLERLFRRIQALRDAAGVLRWDWSTVMPPGGHGSRAEQLATLASLAHGLLVDAAVGDLLDEAQTERPDLDKWQTANLREMRRTRGLAIAVEEDLVEALSRARSACEMAWRAARPAADYGVVLRPFETLLALTREVAAARAAVLECSPYDALLAEYEPGGRVEAIGGLFAELEGFLPELVGQVLEHQALRGTPESPPGPFPVNAQQAVATRFMERLGFEFEHGRLDVSLHPFCGGTPDDVRVTTRYDEADFTESLLAVFHETGHALYTRGLPTGWRGQPVGQARGMSVHESQSLLVEMQACRSREFMGYAAPVLREAFGGTGSAWEAENLWRLTTRVERSFLRVGADEVTYPLHVILRTHLEQAMVAGDLAPSDLPGAWNEGMKRLLGLVPPSDREGCLQDIHWYDGAFGYFPTYTLGALTAAQLFAAARRDLPELPGAIGRGEFGSLLGWLREKVHRLGSLLSTDELVKQATGSPPGTEAFRRHLVGRYLRR